jgi:hypothetical protein
MTETADGGTTERGIPMLKVCQKLADKSDGWFSKLKRPSEPPLK